MLKPKRIIAVLLVLILFCVGILIGIRLGPILGARPATRAFNTPILLQQIQTLSELVTVKYVMEQVEVWNEPPPLILSLFGAGDNHILVLAHGVVKAGVDLKKLTGDNLQIMGTQIVIRLPPAQITDAYLDDSQTKVVERTTGFLRSFDKDLEQNIRETAVNDMRRAALRGGILRDAEDRARKQLGNLFLQLGFTKVEFQSPGAPAPRNLDFTPRETSETTKP